MSWSSSASGHFSEDAPTKEREVARALQAAAKEAGAETFYFGGNTLTVSSVDEEISDPEPTNSEPDATSGEGAAAGGEEQASSEAT